MKLECFQHSGTFKARGALSATKQITEEDKKFGITAASAGIMLSPLHGLQKLKNYLLKWSCRHQQTRFVCHLRKRLVQK